MQDHFNEKSNSFFFFNNEYNTRNVKMTYLFLPIFLKRKWRKNEVTLFVDPINDSSYENIARRKNQ